MGRMALPSVPCEKHTLQLMRDHLLHEQPGLWRSAAAAAAAAAAVVGSVNGSLYP